MKIKYLTDVSKTAIEKGIKDLRGIVSNVNERAQALAVAIIQHDAEHGDCTLAVALMNSLPTAEQKRFMGAFLRHFGAIQLEAKNGVVTNAKHVDPRSRNYRDRDIDGAKANMWYEADESDWYVGPPKSFYVPQGIDVIGKNVLQFGERLSKQLDATKDRGDGQQVPVFALTDEQRKLVDDVTVGLRRLGALMTAVTHKDEVERELARTNKLIEDSVGILGAIVGSEDEAEDEIEELNSEAVNG